MLRVALTWTLTAAFLATLPVTGAGQCPYCHGPAACSPPGESTPARTATPPKCKCCHEDNDQAGPEQSTGNGQKPASPGGTPCDHHFAPGATVATKFGEQPEQERKPRDMDLPADAGAPAVPSSLDSLCWTTLRLAPPDRRLTLRYSHAFRC